MQVEYCQCEKCIGIDGCVFYVGFILFGMFRFEYVVVEIGVGGGCEGFGVVQVG